MAELNVKIKVGTPFQHNSNPIGRFQQNIIVSFKGKKTNGECNWNKKYTHFDLSYNATQHYSTLSSSACVFLSREMNLTRLSLSPKFKEDSAPSPLPHTLEELDMNIDQMRQNYTVWILYSIQYGYAEDSVRM